MKNFTGNEKEDPCYTVAGSLATPSPSVAGKVGNVPGEPSGLVKEVSKQIAGATWFLLVSCKILD